MASTAILNLSPVLFLMVWSVQVRTSFEEGISLIAKEKTVQQKLGGSCSASNAEATERPVRAETSSGQWASMQLRYYDPRLGTWAAIHDESDW